MTQDPPVILSLFVGLPRTVTTNGQTWRSGIWKESVEGPVYLSRTSLEGDAVADTKAHGGPDKAVLAYSVHHYDYWREVFGRILPIGSFGENFTVSGMTEASIHPGDIFEVGQALIQVSQPRVPCWKLARRLERETIIQEIIYTGYSGWYFRVLQEGKVQAGDILLLKEAADAPTVSEVSEAKYRTKGLL